MLFLAYPHLIPSKSGAVEGAPATAPGVTSSGTGGATAVGTGSSLSPTNTEKRKRREEEAIEAAGVGAAGVGSAEEMSTATASLKAERYRPRIFGFQVNEIAKLHRWEEAMRDK